MGSQLPLEASRLGDDDIRAVLAARHYQPVGQNELAAGRAQAVHVVNLAHMVQRSRGGYIPKDLAAQRADKILVVAARRWFAPWLAESRACCCREILLMAGRWLHVVFLGSDPVRSRVPIATADKTAPAAVHNIRWLVCNFNS